MKGDPFGQPWFDELKNSADHAGGRGDDGRDFFNMVCFTNLPVEYTKDVPAFFRHIDMISQAPTASLADLRPLQEVRVALQQFGKIPSKF